MSILKTEVNYLKKTKIIIRITNMSQQLLLHAQTFSFVQNYFSELLTYLYRLFTLNKTSNISHIILSKYNIIDFLIIIII